MEDRLRACGTPLEQMVLMLNDKIDALHARVDELYGHVDSARNAIPWADTGTLRHQDPLPPRHIDEWTRRGWDVWRVTMPREPDAPPTYEITNRRIRADLPTTAFDNRNYERILSSGRIHEGTICNYPIVRELLQGDVS